MREFLASRLPETALLVNVLKRKLGEDRFGADAVDGKARRRASSPRSWKFWQRDERVRKRKREEEGRFCREKRRKETKKERWSKERGKLATHEWLAKRCARDLALIFVCDFARVSYAGRRPASFCWFDFFNDVPMKNKHAPSQSEMNTMATRDLVT